MSDQQTAGVMRARVLGADIRIDVESGSLVVLCLREAKAFDQSTGKVIRTESAQTYKRIPVRVTEHTDLPRLADEIAEKYSCVNPGRRQELLDCLASLRQIAVGGKPDPRLIWKRDTGGGGSGKGGDGHSNRHKEGVQSGSSTGSEAKGEARMENLQEYIEALYEDGESKVAGATRIKELALVSENLEQLAEDKLLLELLSRLLREEAAKSIDLANALVSTALCFSNYRLFVDSLFHHCFDDACFAVVENELKRRSVLTEDLKQRQARAKDGDKEVEAEARRVRRMKLKQDELIALSLHVLMNLCGDPSDNPGVSQKLIQKGLLAMLIRCLDHEGDYSLLIVVTFLKNLSIFHEVVIALQDADVMAKVVPLLGHANPQLREITVRLLSNLSLDPSLQRQLVAAGCVPKLVGLLGDMDLQPTVLKVLLAISANPENRASFSAEGSAQIYQLLVKWPGDKVGDVVVRLATNLIAVEEIAPDVFGGHDGAMTLLERAAKTLDQPLLRLLRTAVSACRSCRKLFEEHAESLVSIAVRAKSRELVADAMGILSSFTSPSIDWLAIAGKYDLVEFLASVIARKPADVADETLSMEAIAVLGAVVANRKIATLIAREDIVDGITAALIRLKQSSAAPDAEATAVRLLYAAYKMLLFKDTRKLFLTSRFTMAVLDWYTGKGKNVRKVVSVSLDIISECDQQLADLIKTRKFELFNATWLSAVRSGQPAKFEAAPNDEDDDSMSFEGSTSSDGLSATSESISPVRAALHKRGSRNVSPAPSPGIKSLSRTASPTVMIAAGSSSASPSPRKNSLGSSSLSPHSKDGSPVAARRQSQPPAPVGYKGKGRNVSPESDDLQVQNLC